MRQCVISKGGDFHGYLVFSAVMVLWVRRSVRIVVLYVCGNHGNRPPCQLCGIPGPSHCHKRFKRDFLGIGNDGCDNERQAAMTTQGHTPSYEVNPSWYMDTGAKDHLTSELSKLTAYERYQVMTRFI